MVSESWPFIKNQSGIDAMIKAYKNRVIDSTKPVIVYRCLNRPGVVYSIKQDGLVVAHSDGRIALINTLFCVSERGRLTVIKNQRKSVHAWIMGYLINTNDMHTRFLRKKAHYNPYVNRTFVDCSGETVRQKPFVTIGTDGVYFAD